MTKNARARARHSTSLTTETWEQKSETAESAFPFSGNVKKKYFSFLTLYLKVRKSHPFIVAIIICNHSALSAKMPTKNRVSQEMSYAWSIGTLFPNLLVGNATLLYVQIGRNWAIGNLGQQSFSLLTTALTFLEDGKLFPAISDDASDNYRHSL